MAAVGWLASVVVLDHDGGPLLGRAVRSVLAQQAVPLELVVVDNGSRAASADRLRGLDDPRLAIVRLARNTGYARGMNTGLARTRGNVVVPMNVDAVLAPDFLARAVEVLSGRPEVGAVAPLVLRVGPDATVDWDAASLLDGAAQQLTRDLRVHSPGDPLVARACFKANGAAPVYRRVALDQVRVEGAEGPFDPVFDTYGEDVDLAFRLARAGWVTWYAPQVRAGHTTSSSSRVALADKRGRLRTNVVAGRHRNAWRHLPRRRLAVTWPLVVAGDVVFVLRRVLGGDVTAVVDVARAWLRVASEAGRLYAERRRRPPPRPTWPPRGRLSGRDRRVTPPSHGVDDVA